MGVVVVSAGNVFSDRKCDTPESSSFAGGNSSLRISYASVLLVACEV